MQAKTTRAFRTISEAGEELELQPHVLRFWESKFSQIKPIKRGGGRRFYRPEDIEFLRGIKILLHDEGHPIKDVQKLIRLKGPGRVLELGQSVQKASREKTVEETVLVPDRIQKVSQSDARQEKPTVLDKPQIVSPLEAMPSEINPPLQSEQTASSQAPTRGYVEDIPQIQTIPVTPPPEFTAGEIAQRRQDLEDALNRLQSLKSRWAPFLATGN